MVETRVYRAAASAYLVFASITGALSVLWLAAVWRAGAPWLPLAVPAGGFVLAALWLAGFRVVLGPEEISFSRPLRRTLRVRRADVLSVEFAESTTRTESPMTLCVRLSTGEELRLNAKIFAPSAVEQLLDLARPAEHRPKALSRY